VIRPSIIESALQRPHPGWIEGFKMAEPLILAYGRGELPEFPAVPDTVIDVVPVDLVANAVLAVAAAPPAAGEGPRYFHLSSGARNPLTYRELYEIVQDYFRAHPLEEPGRGAARVPTWSWPGPYSVERLLGVAERAHTLADRAVGRLPRSQRARELARRVDRAGRRLEFFRRYHDLYRPYVQAELVFDDRGTLELHDSMEPADREAFGFDTAVVDWVHYFRDVHCPSVTRVLRELSAGRRARRPHRSARPVPAERPVVAAFDLEGTLLGSNVIESYLWLRLRELDRVGQLRELGTLGRRLPGYLLTERRDRAAFLRASYRSYAGALFAELVRAVEEDVAPLLLSAVSPAGLRRVREHRAAGHHTVLVTGAIEPVTRPLAPLFDRIEAVQLAVDDTGRCTGFLVRPPLVSEARASWLQEVATERQAGLRDCYAYADSHSDLPLLAAVGHPVAVNPDVSLGRHARRRRWPVEDWPAPGGGRRLAPLLSAARGAG
jgi:HAD superfamily hydrolase (TIGR01490 family)